MATDTPARHIYSGDGSTRVFPIPTYIQGDDYIRIEINGVHQVDRSKWDIVNNSIIFVTAPITTATIDVQVATSVEALSELGSITNVDIVAGINDEIITVANNLDIIENGYSIFEMNEHIVNINNPHNVTKSQVGLSNVDNTSDVNKPISNATSTALNSKQATLVSGTNIKTINGSSVLGSGNIVVIDGTSNQSVDGVKTFTSSPIVPTPTAQDNSAKVATTAYVDGKMVLSTAVATTSGTAIDFTSIPSWAKRITVLFNKVSINNTDKILLRVGSGSIVTTGYTSTCSSLYSASDQIGNGITTNTTGFLFDTNDGAFALSGSVEIFNLSGNLYVSNGSIGSVSGGATPMNLLQTGTITLSGALDRIRLTTVSGTAVFDSGSINIMYEG